MWKGLKRAFFATRLISLINFGFVSRRAPTAYTGSCKHKRTEKKKKIGNNQKVGRDKTRKKIIKEANENGQKIQ